jgi:hypothetical protein
MPPDPKNSGMTDAKCPQMKDKVTVIQRKQRGTHKKGRGLHAWRRMTDGKQSIAEMSRIATRCRITGCDRALFGAIGGAFITSALDADNVACEELCAPVFMGFVDEETIAELDAKEQEDEDHIEDRIKDEKAADFEIEQGNTNNSSVMKMHLKAAQVGLRKEMSDPTMNSKEIGCWSCSKMMSGGSSQSGHGKCAGSWDFNLRKNPTAATCKFGFPSCNAGKNACRLASLVAAIAKLACMRARRKCLLVTSLPTQPTAGDVSTRYFSCLLKTKQRTENPS